MALFLDPDDDEDEDAFGGGRLPRRGQAGRLAGDKPKIPQTTIDALAEAQRRRSPVQQGGFMFPPMLGNNGQALANATMAAHQRENDSRVAQMREMRRLAASQAEEQMKYDYLLKKLAVEQAERDKDRQMQQEMAVSRGLLKKVKRNDGRGGGWYTAYEPV
jgi:hypothetical protein